jgi:hypothetical protein
MTAGEAIMAIALANSLFLSISPDAARIKVLMFLAVSMAPFAVVAPLIGPAIDKAPGGQRRVVMLVGILRAIVMFGMISTFKSLTLFPLAFAALVISKTYAVSKSALVPGVVRSESGLIEANSKLAQVAGIVGFVAAVPAALTQIISTKITLGLGGFIFIFAALNAYRLPPLVVAAKPAESLEVEELHSATVVRASLAMRTLRGLVGFMFFHLAFWLRREIAGTAWFAVAVSVSGLATLAANFAAPAMRQRMRTTTMLLVSLCGIVMVGVLSAMSGRVVAGIALAATVNAMAAIGKVAFDSTVQNDAPDANRGRAFSRFETKNQLAWVIGGLIPVILTPNGAVGFTMVTVIAAVGAVQYARTAPRTRGNRGVRTTEFRDALAKGRERRSH